MNHLEYYWYYETVGNDHICIDCNDPCNGDHADNEGFPLCDECVEEVNPDPAYYIIEYSKNRSPVGTFHIGIAQTRRFLEQVEKLRSLGFTVKTQLIE